MLSDIPMCVDSEPVPNSMMGSIFQPTSSSSPVSMSYNLKLFCWVVGGDSNSIFPVHIESSLTVGDLKEVIKVKKHPEFKEITADALSLWKVSIPEADFEAQLGAIQTPENVQGSEKLRPMRDLSAYFQSPASPAVGHIHVIIANPLGLPPAPPMQSAPRRNITPPEQLISIEKINTKIATALKAIRPQIIAFLENPEPPTWEPPADISDPEIRTFLTGLKLPTYENGTPSLLFHRLSDCDPGSVDAIFQGREHRFVCNTSGSGKTRRLLEGLTRYWGFYLVAAQDIHGVGVSDLSSVMDDVSLYGSWVPDLRTIPFDTRGVQEETNQAIVTKLLKKVLAARIVVFELFLDLAQEIHGSLQEKHKYIWLMFQLSDQPTPNSDTKHPFIHIIDSCLGSAHINALNELVGRLTQIRKKYFPGKVAIIVVDEAQKATQSLPFAFQSSTGETPRSLLREVVRVYASEPVKLVVSGTGLSLHKVEPALTSGISKAADQPPKKLVLFHALGMFDTWDKLEPFLRLYIPDSVLKSSSGYHLQQRIREYLLGRYRFATTFVEYFLRNGLKSPHTLLDAYIGQHMITLPNSGLAYQSDEPQLLVKVKFQTFEWDRLKKDPISLRQAMDIVQSHITKKERPTFGPVGAKLVEYGIAHLRDGHQGQIVEPLAFLSLVQWFNDHEDLSIQANLRLRLSSPESRGSAYEELIILYLLRILRYPVPFNTVFDFYNIIPPWAGEPAHIVGRLNREFVPIDVVRDNPQNPSIAVVHYAATINNILDWLEHLDSAPAILIPSHLHGPDIMAWACFGSQEKVLLMGQLKSFLKGNSASLDAVTISKALTSLNPDHWFKQVPKLDREKLINAIGKHNVLRFVGGYPLPPNFDLQAKSVCNALKALGPNVVLASLKVNTFRAHFISEYEVENVLTPMEHALSLKQ